MVYVKRDGTVVEHQPFAWFWNTINFVTLLFRTLFNANYNRYGDRYETQLRGPGQGPPPPPSRKFGGFGPSGSGPPAPPTGGCGCGG